MSRRKTGITPTSRRMLESIQKMQTDGSSIMLALETACYVGIAQAAVEAMRSTLIDTAEKNAEDAKGER